MPLYPRNKFTRRGLGAASKVNGILLLAARPIGATHSRYRSNIGPIQVQYRSTNGRVSVSRPVPRSRSRERPLFGGHFGPSSVAKWPAAACCPSVGGEMALSVDPDRPVAM